jgi:hypothetical protein
MRVMRYLANLLILMVSIPLLTSGQGNTRVWIIAVNVDSSDPRIQQMLPKLRDRAVKVVEESAKNVRAVVMLGSAATPEAEARKNSADYLLTIELALTQRIPISIGSSPENAPSRTVDVPVGQVPTGITHSRCVDLLGTFTFSYRVISLSGKNISFHDSHIMRDSEYPLGPEWEPGKVNDTGRGNRCFRCSPQVKVKEGALNQP